MFQCGQPNLTEVTSFTLIKGPWPGSKEKEKIVKAAAGVSFSVLLSESGIRTCPFKSPTLQFDERMVSVYTLGSGEHGQLGNGRTGEHIGTRAIGFDTFTEPGMYHLYSRSTPSLTHI